MAHDFGFRGPGSGVRAASAPSARDIQPRGDRPPARLTVTPDPIGGPGSSAAPIAATERPLARHSAFRIRNSPFVIPEPGASSSRWCPFSRDFFGFAPRPVATMPVDAPPRPASSGIPRAIHAPQARLLTKR